METVYDSWSAPSQNSLTDGPPSGIMQLFEQELVSPEEFPKYLNDILERTIRHLGAKYGSLHWLDRQKHTLVVGAEYWRGTVSSSVVAGESLPCDGVSTIAEVARTKKAVLLADLSSPRSPFQYHRRDACRAGQAALAVPLLADDGQSKILVGVLNIDGPQLRVTNPQAQQFLESRAQDIRRGARQAKFSEAMQIIGSKMLTMDQQALLDYTVKVLAEDLLYVHVCSIWLIDKATGKLVLDSAIGRPVINEAGEQVAFARDGFIGKALKDRKPVRSADVLQESSFINRKMAEGEGWVSGFALPILSSHGEPLGVISAFAKEARDFGCHYSRITTFLANQVAIALQQAALLRRVSSLQGISEALVTTTRLDALLQLIVEQATQLLDGAGGIIYLHDTRSGALTAAASCGIAAASKRTSVALDKSLAGWVSHNNTAVRCLANDPRLDQHLAVLIAGGAVVAVPLRAQQRSLGTLCVLNKRGGTVSFDDSDLALLQTLASHAIIAITKIRQTQQLRMLNRIFEESAASRDIDTLLRKATAWLHRAFGYWISIGVLAPKHLISTTVDYNGVTEKLTLSLSQGITSQVARTGQAIMVNDVGEELTYIPCSPDTRAELAVPLLRSKGHPIGVLNIESKRRDAFVPEDLELFKAIAAGVTRAIENACQRTRLNALHDLATGVGKAQNLREVLAALLSTITAHSNISATAIYLRDPLTQRLSLADTKGFPCMGHAQTPGMDTIQSTVEHVFQTGTFEVLEDMTIQRHMDAMPSVTQDLHTFAAVPISTDKEVLGVLAVATETIRSFPNYAIDLLMEIGKSVGAEIEKARLHQSLAETEEKYRRLFEGARDPVLILNPEGIIMDCNEGTTQLCGYTKEALCGKKVSVCLAIRQDQIARIEARLARAMRGEAVDPMEFEMRRKDDSLFTVESNLTPIFNNTGQVTSMYSLWRDVTYRKANENAMRHQNEHLRALLDICRKAFRSLERDDLLAQAAEQALTLVESQDCAIYLRNGDPTHLEMVFPSTQQGNRENEIFDSIIQQVTQTRSGHMHNPTASLHNSSQHILAVPLQSADTFLGVLSVMRPVNQHNCPYTSEDNDRLKSFADVLMLVLEYRRLAEAQHKQQMAARALEQVSLVGAFLGHKLGGFLGSLSLTTDLLARQVRPNDPATAGLLENMVAQGRAAARFAEGFRNMAKPLNAPQDICRMGPLVRRAVEQVRHAGMQGNANVEVTQSLLPSVRANQALLLEVVECLIRNAIDAMPDGGRLSIEGGTTGLHDHPELWLRFRDTGHGIPPEVLKDLFTPFFTTKKDGHSLGIGLWLAKLYLQTLGGDIEAKSVVGQGSTFTLRLPVTQDTGRKIEKATRHVAPQMDRFQGVHTGGPEQANVLIVEDDPGWQGLLSSMLLSHNIQAQVAQSHSEAQTCLAQTGFDAFIVDVQLVSHEVENCDGLDIATQILTQHANASILILSSWSYQLEQAQHFRQREKEADIHVANKTRSRQIEKAIEAFCRRLRQKTPSHMAL